MLWGQSGISAIVWVCLGIWAAHRAGRSGVVRPAWSGIVLMVGAAAVMFGGMAILATRGGIVNGLLTPGAWIAVTLLGSIFAMGQSIGAVWTLRAFSGPETGDNRGTSNRQEPPQ